MTSTPVILLLKRSGQASDRPQTSVVQNGELAIAVGAADPGLYFEDSAGSIRKIGPSAYGTTAPNSTPVGLAGNSVGELWTDSSTSSYYLKVWTGAAWQKVGAAFADSATSATSASTASFATTAATATIASGAVLASGAILASGSIQSSTVVLSGLPSPSINPSGTLVYQVQSSGIYAAGLYVRATTGWLLV
jgi:hypothetical protein